MGSHHGVLSDDAIMGYLDKVVELVGALSGMPCAYVPYGYGMYIMLELHDIAREELGGKYSEVEFNKLLLAEGMGPTLDRAIDITSEYVK